MFTDSELQEESVILNFRVTAAGKIYDSKHDNLATGFQNMILDSKNFPADLRAKIYDHLKTNVGC